MTQLLELNTLPEGFLSATPQTVHRVLAQPTLLHLPGRRPEPLFVSVLLHGNEGTGLAAVQSVLRARHARELPRALSIFVGNVEAAAQGLRHLDGQPDFNRVWPGTPHGALPEAQLAQQVVEAMTARRVFASIDIHNNTGLNPYYGCVNRLDASYLHLATLFSRIVVYFKTPLGVQSAAFAPLCPAVTVECGKPGNPAGDTHAARFIEAALHLEHFPEQPVRRQDIDVYHTVATVKVPQAVAFSFDDTYADIRFVSDLDHMNFRDLAPGTVLARIQPQGAAGLEVHDEHGAPVFEHYFEVRDDLLRIRRAVTPAMLTLDAGVIRQDCLCYLMERIVLP